jgi:hypothetical protein
MEQLSYEQYSSEQTSRLIKLETIKSFRYGGQQIGGLRGGIPSRYPVGTISCGLREKQKRIARTRINVNVTEGTASGASGDRIGKVIAMSTRANNKSQIPIFRMSQLSIDIRNSTFVFARIGFSVENVNLIVLMDAEVCFAAASAI